MLFPPSLSQLSIQDLQHIRAGLSAESTGTLASRTMTRCVIGGLLAYAYAREVYGWGAYSYAVASASRNALGKEEGQPPYSLHTTGPDGRVWTLETTADLTEMMRLMDQYVAVDPTADLWTTDRDGALRVFLRGVSGLRSQRP
jgi:hypothetical protein